MPLKHRRTVRECQWILLYYEYLNHLVKLLVLFFNSVETGSAILIIESKIIASEKCKFIKKNILSVIDDICYHSSNNYKNHKYTLI